MWWERFMKKRNRVLAEETNHQSGVIPAQPAAGDPATPAAPAAGQGSSQESTPASSPSTAPGVADSGQAELTRLQQALAAETAKVSAVQTAAITELKKAALATNPLIPEALLEGATSVEDFTAKLASATAIVEQVKASTLAQAQQTAAATPPPPVSSGGGSGATPDVSAMTPREKILYALDGNH